MQQRLVIIGAGFAGMYAALSAARLRDRQGVALSRLAIALIAPEPTLVVRPRLYEPYPERLTAPLQPLLDAIGVSYVQGSVEAIDTGAGSIGYRTSGGATKSLGYDRLVIATGSRLFRPDIPGLAEFSFSVDSLPDAMALDRHLRALAERPASPARNTVVVAGGGFTGIEVATEMPARLRDVLGRDAETRVVIVERGGAIGKDIGAAAQPHIQQALKDLKIQAEVGVGVGAVDAAGVVLTDGRRIDSATVIWAAGMRAAPLTAAILAERDNAGRLVVDRDLRVPGVTGVFATGDAARVACDDVGHDALMSCQHATRMGAFAGNNAAADLLGLAPQPYHQEAYVTCLDLGQAGAILTRGWDRRVELLGAEAKAMKHEINTVWIYPPPADAKVALAAADPQRVTDL